MKRRSNYSINNSAARLQVWFSPSRIPDLATNSVLPDLTLSPGVSVYIGQDQSTVRERGDRARAGDRGRD
jgi:hypothetical protein